MEKVLRKRAWRDLKENKFRYFAFKPQGLELDVYIPRRQFNKDP